MQPFKKDGGPIMAEVTAGQAQVGSYDLKLWEANRNEIVQRWEGDFLNPDDDKYPLPQPNEANHKRRIQAVVVITLVPPIDKYSTNLIITQDGRELDKISQTGQTSNIGVRCARDVRAAVAP